MALGESRFVIVRHGHQLSRAMSASAPPSGPGSSSPAGRCRTPGCSASAAGTSTTWFLRTPADDRRAALRRPPGGRTPCRSGPAPHRAEEEQRPQEHLDQLGRYLGLVALIALLLGGIGVGSAVQVFIRRSAIPSRCSAASGATSGQVFAVYLLQAVGMGLAGSALGVALGLVHPAGAAQRLRRSSCRSMSRCAPRSRAVAHRTRAWASGSRRSSPCCRCSASGGAAARGAPARCGPARRPRPIAGPGSRGSRSAERRGAGEAAGAEPRAGRRLLRRRSARRCWCSGSRPSASSAPCGAGSRTSWPTCCRQGLANLYRPANQTVAVVLALGFGAFLLGALAVMPAQPAPAAPARRRPRPAQPRVLRHSAGPAGGGGALIRTERLEPPGAGADRADAHRARSTAGRSAQLLADTAAGADNRDGERIAPLGAAAGVPLDLPGHRRRLGEAGRGRLVEPERRRGARMRRPRRGRADLTRGRHRRRSGRHAARHASPGTFRVCRCHQRHQHLREVNWARFEPNFFAVFPGGPLDEAPQSYVLLTRVDDPAAMRPPAAARRWSGTPTSPRWTSRSMQQTIEKIVGQRGARHPLHGAASVWPPARSCSSARSPPAGSSGCGRRPCSRPSAPPERQVIRVMVTEYRRARRSGDGRRHRSRDHRRRGADEMGLRGAVHRALAGFGLLALTLLGLTVVTGLWTSPASSAGPRWKY